WDSLQLCLTEGLKGRVLQLQLNTDDGDGCRFGVPNAQDFLVDELAIAAVAACPSPAWIIDGDFETVSAAQSWVLHAPLGTPPSIAGGSTHSGSQALHLSVTHGCDHVSASTIMTVPPSAGAAGPVVTFWANVQMLGASQLFVNAGTLSQPFGPTL